MVNSASVYGEVSGGLMRRLADYLFPVLLLSITGALQFFLPMTIPPSFTLLILILVVFLSARVGGIGPGLLGTVLGSVLEWMLWPAAGVSASILFAGIGVIVSVSMVPLRLAVGRAIREHNRQILEALSDFTCILTLEGIVAEV